MFKTVGLILFLSATSWGSPETTAKAFLSQPTALGARELVRAGSASLAPLVAGYSAQTPETRIEVLKVVLALPESAEKKTFLSTVAKDAAETPKAVFLASFADLLENPSDVARQTAFEKYVHDHHQDGVSFVDFDFGFYGDRGLLLLSSFLSRAETLSTGFLGYLVLLLHRDFPREADEIVIPVIDRLTKTAFATLPQDPTEVSDRIQALFTGIENTRWRDQFVVDVLKDTSFADDHRLRSDLAFRALTQTSAPVGEQAIEAISKYYCNAETSPKDDKETNDHFYYRRERLLGFGELLLSLQKSGQEKAASELFLENAVFMAQADLGEFQVMVERVASQDTSPRPALEKIMMTSDATILIAGLRMMRQVPLERWKGPSRANLDFKARVLGLSQFGLPAVPESVRIEAAQTYAYLTDDSQDTSAILVGLGAKDPGDRIKTIQFLADAEPSVLLTEAITRVLDKDPDEQVKMAALQFVKERIEAAALQGRRDSFVESYRIGEKIFFCFTSKDPKFLEAADETLDVYLEHSPHTTKIVQQAAKSSVAEVSAEGNGRIPELLLRRIGEFKTVLISVLPYPPPKWSESVMQSLKADIDQRLKEFESEPKP